MKFVFFIFWILVIIIGISFASLNSYSVTINYYINESHIPIPILLLITLAFGVLLGIVTMLPAWLRSKQNNRRLKNRIKQIEQEVNNLRAIPIKETH